MRIIRGCEGGMIYPFFYILLLLSEIKNDIPRIQQQFKQNKTSYMKLDSAWLMTQNQSRFLFSILKSGEISLIYIIFFFPQESNETHIEHLPLGSRTC